MHPEAYHGRGRRGPFFEAWYLRLVTGDRRRSVSVIPGIFRGRDPSLDHAFVYVVDDETFQTTQHRFEATDFEASETAFDVRVGPNHFSAAAIELAIDDEQRRLCGRVELGPLVPWPVRPWSPGVMGWFSWVPTMECYHGIVSLDHALRGRLDTHRGPLGFDGGRGYIEKDWGRSFPSTWVWVQTNGFDEPGVCLTASIARVPWRGRSFPGFLVGLYRRGRLEPFTTHGGAKLVELQDDGRTLRMALQRGDRRLEVSATRGRTASIPAPTPHGMVGRVQESLDARVYVRLTHGCMRGRRRGLMRERVEFEGMSTLGGLEVQGDAEALVQSLLR